MSLNHLVDTVEKKWMNIGCENLVVYGSASIPDVKTNKVELADGSAGLPSLTFQNQTNTGLYRVGASEIGVSCNGVQILDVNQGSLKINAQGFPNDPLVCRLNVGQGQNVGNNIASFYGGGQRVAIIDQDLSVPNRPPQLAFSTGAGGDIKLNGKKAIQLYDNSSGPFTSVICGTQATLPANATDGFLYVPVLVGPPTGTPTTVPEQCPIFVDTVNQFLYAYCNGAWKKVALA